MIREHLFENRETLAVALANAVCDQLLASLASRSTARLVLSGGTTPRRFLRQLQGQPLPWEDLTLTLADERWVPRDHPESNEAMIRGELLSSHPQEAHWISLRGHEATPEEAAANRSPVIEGLCPFDVVVLGMGVDGHTASLFPRSEGLDRALGESVGRGVSVVRSATLPRERLTLTLPSLLDTQRLVLHIEGEEKWKVYQTARQAGPTDAMPVRAVLRRAQGPLDVYWSP